MLDWILQLRWLKPSFPQLWKLFLHWYFISTYFSVFPKFILSTNLISTGQEQSPFRHQWKYSYRLTSISLLWVWLLRHKSITMNYHSVYISLFSSTRTSCAAVKIPAERETQYTNSILLMKNLKSKWDHLNQQLNFLGINLFVQTKHS